MPPDARRRQGHDLADGLFQPSLINLAGTVQVDTDVRRLGDADCTFERRRRRRSPMSTTPLRSRSYRCRNDVVSP